jgi:DNA-binding CsgD family transcriptional regulator
VTTLDNLVAVPTAFQQRLIEIAAQSRSGLNDINLSYGLNILDEPAVIIDVSGFVIETNERFETLPVHDVSIINRRLHFRDSFASAQLRQAVAQVKSEIKLPWALPEPIIVRCQEGLPLILRVWALQGEARWPAQDACAVLTLKTLDARPTLSSTILSKAFGLTPAESKVAVLIARGIEPKIAAQALGISPETARKQLKSIFAKTDTRRQGELIALLLRMN